MLLDIQRYVRWVVGFVLRLVTKCDIKSTEKIIIGGIVETNWILLLHIIVFLYRWMRRIKPSFLQLNKFFLKNCKTFIHKLINSCLSFIHICQTWFCNRGFKRLFKGPSHSFKSTRELHRANEFSYSEWTNENDHVNIEKLKKRRSRKRGTRKKHSYNSDCRYLKKRTRKNAPLDISLSH